MFSFLSTKHTLIPENIKKYNTECTNKYIQRTYHKTNPLISYIPLNKPTQHISVYNIFTHISQIINNIYNSFLCIYHRDNDPFQ